MGTHGPEGTPGNFAWMDGVEAAIADRTTPTDVDAKITDEHDTERAHQSSTYVPQAVAQTAEGVPAVVFAVTPATAGAPKFAVQQQSYPNLGAGAGTYNHATFTGYNTGRHSGGPVVAGKAAMIMGFEDNYYDYQGSLLYGPEWYVEYWSADGATWQMFRPFYARIQELSAGQIMAAIHFDIGNNVNGAFTILSDFQHGITKLFEVTTAEVQVNRTLNVNANMNMTGAMQVTAAANGQIVLVSAAGQSSLTLDSPVAPHLDMKYGGALAWALYVTSTTSFQISDGARAHLSLTKGTTVLNSLTDLASSLKVQGNVGFFGTTPTTKRATTADSTDLATVITLANALKADLIAYGLKS